MPPLQALQQMTDLAFAHAHVVEMTFLPQAWEAAANCKVAWTEVPFPPDPRSQVPDAPGVYAFVVSPCLFDLEAASGLFYIGKATSLYDRIGAYIGEIDKDLKTTRRAAIWRMVNLWHGHLTYLYSVTATVGEAETLETKLITAFGPPFNSRIEGIIGHIGKAF